MRFLLFLLWAMCLSVPSPADEVSPRKVALLVGVNEYAKPGFKPLKFAEADVRAVGEELAALGFEVTRLLGSGQGQEQATRENIYGAARRLVAPLGQGDLVLVMLSGHGQQLSEDPEAAGLESSQCYFCPVDAVMNHPETQVSLSYLLDDILAPNVGRKMLIVDACRDIPVDRSRGRNAKGVEGRLVTLPEGTAVFFSCSAGQTSFERDELKHGLFTYCVLEALRGEAVHRGEIAWSSLVAHVDRRMADAELTQFMPKQMRQVPIPAGALPYTVLGRVNASMGRPSGTTPAEPSPAAKVSHPALFVISVGVNGDRKVASGDAAAVEALFRAHAPGKFQHFDSRVLAGDELTAEALLTSLDWLANKVGTGDTCVLYFNDGSINAASRQIFSTGSDPKAGAADRRATPLAEFVGRFGELCASQQGVHRLVLLDCWNGAPVISSGALNDGGAALGISSCSPGEAIVSSPQSAQGAFVLALTAAVRPEADIFPLPDGDGILTQSELWLSLQDELARQSQGRQKAVLWSTPALREIPVFQAQRRERSLTP